MPPYESAIEASRLAELLGGSRRLQFEVWGLLFFFRRNVKRFKHCCYLKREGKQRREPPIDVERTGRRAWHLRYFLARGMIL